MAPCHLLSGSFSRENERGQFRERGTFAAMKHFEIRCLILGKPRTRISRYHADNGARRSPASSIGPADSLRVRKLALRVFPRNHLVSRQSRLKSMRLTHRVNPRFNVQILLRILWTHKQFRTFQIRVQHCGCKSDLMLRPRSSASRDNKGLEVLTSLSSHSFVFDIIEHHKSGEHKFAIVE